jgi:hypothetical protein
MFVAQFAVLFAQRAHMSSEHLCYENAVRRSSLASDYDVDKRLITRCTSTASLLWSPTATLEVASHTWVPLCRVARRLCCIDRETRVANVLAFTLLKDSWMCRASFTRKFHCDPEGFRVTHHEIMRWVNIYLVFHKLDWQNTCVWVTHAIQLLIGTWNVLAIDWNSVVAASWQAS